MDRRTDAQREEKQKEQGKEKRTHYGGYSMSSVCVCMSVIRGEHNENLKTAVLDALQVES